MIKSFFKCLINLEPFHKSSHPVGNEIKSAFCCITWTGHENILPSNFHQKFPENQQVNIVSRITMKKMWFMHCNDEAAFIPNNWILHFRNLCFIYCSGTIYRSKRSIDLWHLKLGSKFVVFFSYFAAKTGKHAWHFFFVFVEKNSIWKTLGIFVFSHFN